MNDVTNINLQEIFIVNIIVSGSGFAQVADSGANVFIPASVVNGAQLQVGERVDAVLVPNMNEMRERTPWRAVRVPRQGKYFVLVISRSKEGAVAEVDALDLRRIARFFESATELIGSQKYQFSEERFAADRKFDVSFE